METILEFIRQPWHWTFSGAMFTLTMGLLVWFGRDFGLSSNYRTVCSLAGAGRRLPFFDIDMRENVWNLAFAGGIALGGLLASRFLSGFEPVRLSAETICYLQSQGLPVPAEGPGLERFLPVELFNLRSLFTWRGFILMAGGGFLLGFGARWAGGCTSGHSISGLSELQLPSLLATMGFFAGGWGVTNYLLPIIFSL